LRYFNVFGPRQSPTNPYSGVISIFIDHARRGQSPTIFGDGKQTRDFIAVEDVVQANLAAMASAKKLGGEAFNVASGRSISLLDLWAAIQEAAGVKIEPKFEPARAGDIRHSSASTRKIRDALDFRPRREFGDAVKALLS
ncbi:MAG: NAD-dependent epimerase/dehydratase family protein, partial [Verrucomicrobiae bacterium]|nr:NAD-dependent epimerase/dehydratase family protein [Verrucomicrobiae bacterium]